MCGIQICQVPMVILPNLIKTGCLSRRVSMVIAGLMVSMVIASLMAINQLEHAQLVCCGIFRPPPWAEYTSNIPPYN